MKLYAIVITFVAIIVTIYLICKCIKAELDFIALFAYCEDKNILPTKQELESYRKDVVSYCVGIILKR